MFKPASGKAPRSTWLWLTILILLFIVLIAWFVDPLGYAGDAQPGEPAAQPTGWVAAPEGSAVPVTLPTVTVTSSPETPPQTEASQAGR